MLRKLLRYLIGLLSMFAISSAYALSTIYLSPTGNDRNEGTVDDPVVTLQRALDIAYGKKIDDASEIEVRVRGGTYLGQSATVTLPNIARKISIIGEIQNGQRPLFVKGGKNRTWLRVNADNGQQTNLTIKNLEVRDYFSAIFLVGNRNYQEKGNLGTHIENNVFRKIGSTKRTSNGRISTGVIILVNSSNNVVTRNQFINIKNDKACGALHALYVAHFSKNNIFKNNIFQDACGSAIKFRDRASNNQVIGNKFKNIVDAPPVEEWFCDKGARKDCTKKFGECPSTENVVRDNSFPSLLSAKDKIEQASVLKVGGNNTMRSWCEDRQFRSSRFIQ